MRQVLGPGALGIPRGIGWRGRWEVGSGWGIHVNPWLIHVNVWQNPLQYCKVISLQLIKINEKKKLVGDIIGFEESDCRSPTYCRLHFLDFVSVCCVPSDCVYAARTTGEGIQWSSHWTVIGLNGLCMTQSRAQTTQAFLNSNHCIPAKSDGGWRLRETKLGECRPIQKRFHHMVSVSSLSGQLYLLSY